MNLTYSCKNLKFLLLLSVGVFLASAFLFSVAMAAEEAQIEAAVEDLSAATGQSITTEEQARSFCNQEQYFDVCADIGKKHDLYEAEELKHVNDFLAEVKGKILDDIKSCTNEECLVKVAGELAQKIKTKNPTLATDFKLTDTIVAEKQAVVQAAKEVGVNFKDCEAMDPDTATVDLLRRCARLAKDTRVQKYIPEEKRAQADQFGDSTIKLREGLSTGKYQCGDGTLEGCGNFCLKPTAGTQATGIPAVCKQIAAEIFGPDGVKELESAHQQVGQVKDYYAKKFILTLPDGRELVGEGQIRNACDKAFSGRKLEVAKACGSFAVQNGFASQAEVEKGLKLMESFTQRGQNTSFDQCVSDPIACREFIPEDERGQFDAGNQIFEMMKTEIGFDPSQCERGSVDQAIGTKCFEGSKRALAKIEGLGLANKSREARFIIEEIKGHLTEGESHMQRKDEFRQVFQQQGGPGGCRSESECFAYCSDPNNGPECIAFGSKQNISGFRGQEAVEKFQEYNQNIQRPGLTSNEYKEGDFHQFPGQGPYPGFQPPGQGGFPPGQFPGFNQPGPGFNPPPGVGGFYPGPGGGGFGGPAGPSPECFAAIQSGDFVRAKTVCTSSVPTIPVRQFPVCPASPYVECPAGQYHESFRNNDGCWIDGPCRSAPSYSAGPYPTYGEYKGDANSCPGFAYSRWDKNGKRYCQLNTERRCDYNYPSYLTNGSNYVATNCPVEDDHGIYPTNTYYATPPAGTFCGGGAGVQCPAGYYCQVDGTYPDAGGKCVSEKYPLTCPSGQWWNPETQSCKTTSPSDTPPPGSKPQCSDGLDNDKDGKTDYPADSSCYGPDDWDEYYPTVGTSPYPTYSPSYSPPPGGVTQCSDGKDNDGDGAIDYPSDTGCYGKDDPDEAYSGPTVSGSPYPSPSGSCPAGYHYHGESGGFCMNDQESYSGTCYNATGTSKITCPAVPSSTPPPSCPSGQWWDYAKSMCVSSTTTTYTPYPTYSSAPGTTYTPPPSCPSGQWWDPAISACKSTTPYNTAAPYPSYTPYPTVSYTPYPTTDPAASCTSSGGTWSGSTCVYPTPATTTYTPYPTETHMETHTCPSGQFWNGSACVVSSVNGRSMVAHCQQLGRTWNGSICEANGLLARIYEDNFASILRAFRLVP